VFFLTRIVYCLQEDSGEGSRRTSSYMRDVFGHSSYMRDVFGSARQCMEEVSSLSEGYSAFSVSWEVLASAGLFLDDLARCYIRLWFGDLL